MQAQEQQQTRAREGAGDPHAQPEDQQELGLPAQHLEQFVVDSTAPPSLLLSQMRAKLDPLQLPFPTVQALVNARRYDLVYALRQHDRHKLAQRCGYTLDGISYATGGSAAGCPNGVPASLASSSRSRASGAAIRKMLLSLLLGQGLPNKGHAMQTGTLKSRDDRANRDGVAVQHDKGHAYLGALSARTNVGTAGTDGTITEAVAPVGRQEWSPKALHQVLLAAGVNVTWATIVAQLRLLVGSGQIQRLDRGVYAAHDPDR